MRKAFGGKMHLKAKFSAITLIVALVFTFPNLSSTEHSDEHDDLEAMFDMGEQCEEPLPPMNGEMQCGRHKKINTRFVCKAECDEGYQFPNGKPKRRHICDMETGKWTPDFVFPECEPICDPPCQNGGRCTEQNHCVCLPGYRGSHCEYSHGLCNPSDALDVKGDWRCNHTSLETMCVLNCPQGTQFETQPADLYHCSLDGAWTPDSAPKCLPMNIIEPPSSHGIFPISTGQRTQTVSSDVCVSWSQLHYRTFDGGMFSFQGECTYLLSKDCSDNTFAIHVNNAGPCESPSNCQVSVVIYVGPEEFLLTDSPDGPVVEYQGQTHIVPTAVRGMLFQPLSDYVSVTSPLGFRLKWNRKGTVLLKMGNQMKNKTCGLCGRFDGSVLNDFEMPDGTITDNVEAFVNSWTMNSLEGQCRKGAVVEHPCNSVEKIYAEAATRTCERIHDAKFSPCHTLVDPRPYYEACRMDYCSCSEQSESCICNSLEEYFRECLRLGGQLEGGWRSEELCPRSCPAGMVYEDCGSSCPMTCKSTVYSCEDEHCVDGCHCPEGTLLHQNQCLPKSLCPCTHSGKEYDHGSRITQECNACECLGGRWECTKEKCEARCSSTGDPHYTTFDGVKYEFLGSCPYYLVYHNNFTIVQENGPCPRSPESAVEGEHSTEAEFCTDSIAINYQESNLVLKPNTEPVFDDKGISSYPFSENGLTIDEASSMFLKVELSNGVSLLWDGKNRIYIDVPPSMFGQTEGLCGTFNRNQNDDFVTPEGDLEADITVFASRWKASDSCHKRSRRRAELQPCAFQQQKLPDATHLCSLLKNEIFEACHNEVDPDPFYRSCVSDLCACTQDLEECLCASLSDYAATCSRKGVVVNWAGTVAACMPRCENGQVYQECGNPCKTSCLTISMSEDCQEKCVQGCACPDGMTLNADGFCVPIDQCPCVYKGKEYTSHAEKFQGTNVCRCENAVWNCRSARLEELVRVGNDMMVLDKPFECDSGNHQEYTQCMPACRRTCQNLRLPTDCLTIDCNPGCKCKDGYVLDEDLNKCVRLSECGCRHGRRKYAERSRIQKNCNLCTCEQGAWKCTEKVCPGICTAWGESHFKTFDGRIFDFHGDCDYTLVKGTLEGAEFSLSMRNVPCGTSGITCSKSFTLDLGEDIKVTLSRDEPLPTDTYGSRLMIYEVGLFVSVYTDIGITLRWDKGTRMYITVDPQWREKVVGLCGNFNDDQFDDFLSPFGGIPEVRPTLFADSWKIQETCPASQTIDDACLLHPDRETWARQKCSVIKSELFSSCHSEVALGPFYERCVFDTCACDIGGDCECLCTTIAAYAQECNVHGVHIAWRTQELCPIQCEECATYESCMTPCPVRTCESQPVYENIDCDDESCIEGCNPKPCPSGQIFNNVRELKCIPEVECVVPCMEINGRMYNEGERITDPYVADACQSCHCLRGSVSCTGEPCPTTTPVITLPTVECRQTGWTQWINTPKAIGGDYENMNSFALFSAYSGLCGPNNVTDIECRVEGSKVPYKETGQNVLCALPDGLICKDELQNSELCEDYEIRLYCDCGPVPTTATAQPTTTERVVLVPPMCQAPGWTYWLNSFTPNENGEFETIRNLRRTRLFCPDDEIENIECRNALTGLEYDGEDPHVTCDKNTGLECVNTDDYRCDDYEVRFRCRCSFAECDYPRGMKNGNIKKSQITVSSFWTEEYDGDSGRVNGLSAWRSGNVELPQWIQVDLEEDQEITGVYTQGNPLADEWVTTFKMSYSQDGEEFTYVKDSDGNDKIFSANVDRNSYVYNEFPTFYARYVKLIPVGWHNWISLRFELLGCNRGAVCAYPRGMEKGYIKDSQILVSSFWMEDTGGNSSRLNGKSAWRTGNVELQQWIQVDLEEQQEITGIVTQGSPISDEWVKVYKVSYSNDGVKFTFVKDSNGLDHIFIANEDGNTEVENTFSPIYARFVRIIPVEWHNWISMRFEILGCNVKEEGVPPRFPPMITPTTTVITTTIQVTTPELVPTTTPTTSTTEVTTTISPCPPGQVFDLCAYPCDQTCLSFLETLQSRGECTEKECVEGCRPAHGCDSPNFWRDFATCVSRDECTCIYEDALLAPNEVVEKDCMKCQCTDNNLDCFKIPYCGETTPTGAPHIIETTVNIVNEDCWTDWINIDTPLNGGGDLEIPSKIRKLFEFCLHPVEIECRSVDNKQKASDTGQNVQCDLLSGLQCWNSQQNEGNDCYDYEIRFFCPCATVPLPTTPITTLPPSTMAPAPCTHGWTEWFNKHKPDSYEEYETVQSIRMAGGYFCSNDMITAIECRKTSGPAAQSLESGVICDLEVGLMCRNSDLSPLMSCSDYEVRFFCDCPTQPPTTEATTPRPTTTTITTMKEITTLAIKPCAQWSDWINEHHPYTTEKGSKKGQSTGDYEKRMLLRFQNQEDFCLEGELTAIECRDAETDLDYTETGDLKLKCNLKTGFRCRNKDQRSDVCRDYKIRYFCSCVEETSTTVIVKPKRPNIITPPPPVAPCSSYYQVVDGPFPLPDSNLRASTSKDPSSGPQSARLSSVQGLKSSGAWIAGTLDVSQYLEIDLGKIQPIYGVVTKGRDGADEWVKSYYVLFSRDGISYTYVYEEPDFQTEKEFPGNYDSDTLVEHIFRRPFEARYVRIQPVTYMREIALRADVLGCAEGFTTVKPTTTYKPPICEDEMGMENGNISDSQITASSFRGTSSGTSFIRLNTVQTGHHTGGWVADILDENQYVQIDFLEPRTVTGIITQGRELVSQWVTSYTVLYSQDGADWNFIMDVDGKAKVFPGNFDSDTTVQNFFPHAVRAQFIRIKPLTWNNWISMRLEVLGCFEPYPVISTTTVPCTLSQKSQRATCEIHGPLFNTFDGYAYDYEICDHVLMKATTYADFSVQVHKECYGKYGNCSRYIVIRHDGNDIQIGPKLDDVLIDGNEVPFQNFWVVERRFPDFILNRTKDHVMMSSLKYDFTVTFDYEQNIKILISACPSYEILGLCGNSNGDTYDDQQRPDGSLATGSKDFGDSWSIGDMDHCIREECRSDTMAEAVEICHWLKVPPLSICASYVNIPALRKDCIDFICDCSPPVSTNPEDSCRCKFYQRFVDECSKTDANLIGRWKPALACEEQVKEFSVVPTTPKVFELCYSPMGFESKDLPDSFILVSSSASPETDGSRIRLGTHSNENGAGGWVASSLDYNPSVMIDFFGLRNITGIITQGREDADMWVVSYTVQYSLDGVEWKYCVNSKNMSIFIGNDDRSSPVVHYFAEMVEAEFVKIVVQDYHGAPAMRLELLGCFVPYAEVSVPPVITTTEFCIEYGPWISLSEPTPNMDEEEPLESVIQASGICDNPMRIQCRTAITKTDYTATGQNVICDLTRGLLCRNMDQNSGYCKNYEVRIGCWSCGPPSTTMAVPVALCPETPITLEEQCPTSCPADHACDGTSCVPHTDCPCFQEGKRFPPGDRMITSECLMCDCILEGHSKCKPMTCPDCKEGQKSELTKDCKCICTGCPVGEHLCPSNGQCLELKFWCDGVVHCPDDEIGCPTTAPPTTTETTYTPSITPTPFICLPEMQSERVTCEMAVNLFNTFDGLEYQYEICDHVLMEDHKDELFGVTVHKKCLPDQKTCSRYVVIYVEDETIKLGPGAEDLYLNDYEIPIQNLWLVTKRYPDFVFRKEGNNLVVGSLKYNFDVTWDSRQEVKITMSKCSRRQVVGLCGFYNDHMDDDRLKPDGSLASGNEEFGDSWSIGNLDRCVVPKCPVDIMTVAFETCQELNEIPFSNCSSYLNIASHSEACMAYMCECLQRESEQTVEDSTESCKCKAYGSFVEACEKISTERIHEWRLKYDCAPKCPPGMEWHECGSGCELTCDNYRNSDEICTDQCIPGCYCPAGLVRHRNRCIRPKMCQDCVCRGHGDPNYITFDGHYYAFQGNCTYVLAQHMSDDHRLNFQVLATNVECPEEPHTSCTAGIKVIWNDHTVVKFKNEPIHFDGRVLNAEDFPFEDESFTISYVPQKSAVIHVKDINLVVRYFDQMYGYNIELPSYLYFNQTEGLCGICNFIESDDMYHKDGYITDNIDDFAYSWLVGSTRDECTLPRVVVPTPEPEICNFTSSPCEMLLDSTMYSKSCLNDVTYSTNARASMCRSKVQYAQQCCERGVSLSHWLLESGCSFSCEEDMVLECTSSCQRTCENYKNYDPYDCTLSPLLTCNCPPDKVFKFGKCVEPKLCEICDDQGHVIGDEWTTGPCETCSCLENRVVHCTTRECSQPPICTTDEELQALPQHKDACCQIYRCIQVAKELCSVPSIPDCEPGQVAKSSIKNDSCLVYECQCDEKLCPPLVRPTSLEEGEEYVLVKKGCCSQYESQCIPDKCRGPIECGPGFKLSTFDGKCCTQRTCVPKKNVCVYQHQFEVVNGTEFRFSPEQYYDKEYESSSSWKDGLCRQCSCIESDGQLSYKCTIEICPDPSQFPDADSYVREAEHIPGMCCPKYRRVQCVHDGVMYSVGDEWPSPDGDKCKSYRCIVSVHGDVTRLERTMICDVKCPKYAVYVEPEPELPDCCGHCKLVGCEENGTIYQDGATWQSETKPCFNAECIVTGNLSRIMYRSESCPAIPSNCPPEDIVLDSKGCCRQCTMKRAGELCSPSKIPEHETSQYFVIHDRVRGICTNNKVIKNLSRCSGKCESGLMYKAGTNYFESTCKCCVPSSDEMLEIVLDCSDGSQLKKTYRQPSACHCSSCSGNELYGFEVPPA